MLIRTLGLAANSWVSLNRLKSIFLPMNGTLKLP